MARTFFFGDRDGYFFLGLRVIKPMAWAYARLLLLQAFDLFDFARQVLVGGKQLAQLDEGAGDKDAHLHGLPTIEHGGEHYHTVLGEGIGQHPQAEVASYGLIEAFCGRLIERGQIESSMTFWPRIT